MADSDVVADDEISLPRATVGKLIHEMLSPGISVTKETRDLLVDCCVRALCIVVGVADVAKTEFIHLVSSEANDICEKETRKTISPEHVVQALQALGFDSFIAEVKESWDEHRSLLKDREKRGRKLGMDDMTQEEAMAAQEAMFQQARLRMQQRLGASTAQSAESTVKTEEDSAAPQ